MQRLNKIVSQVSRTQQSSTSRLLSMAQDANEEKQQDVKSLPKIILGAMEFGRALKFDDAIKLTKIFLDHGHKEIDTALMYSGGNSEKFLSRMDNKQSNNLLSNNLLSNNNALIATKANPSAQGGLTNNGIISQCDISFKRLNTQKVDLFYLHWPDHNVDINESLKAINQLYKQGKFQRLGLSNYASWQVAEIYYICKQNNYPMPLVYQGMYNPLTRDVEKELFPCLRKFNINFYAYNPLAGGLLTGKHKYSQINESENKNTSNIGIQKGRFHGNEKWAKAYRNRFWHKSYFDGIDIIIKSLEKEYGNNVNIVQACLRWMRHHSKLKENDGIILGASSMTHFEVNLEALENNEPLSESVVNAFDEAWNLCKKDCPIYFR